MWLLSWFETKSEAQSKRRDPSHFTRTKRNELERCSVVRSLLGSRRFQGLCSLNFVFHLMNT